LELSPGSQDTQQEVRELVSDLKNFDLEIKLPNIDLCPLNFKLVDEVIYFGIKDIKSMTGVTGDRAMSIIEEFKKENPEDKTWVNILLNLGGKLSSNAMTALISLGFFTTRSTKVTRSKALYDYGIFKALTGGEKKWLKENYKPWRWESFTECMRDLAPRKKEGGGTHNEARKQHIIAEIQLLENPPFDLEDDPSWIIAQEQRYLGCPISYARVDAADSSDANTTCRDLNNEKKGKHLVLVVNLVRVANHKIKKDGDNKGRVMSFLTLEDASGTCDNVVCFPDVRDVYGHYLSEDANVLIIGEVKNKGDSLVVSKICEI
jgi:DNA polymerase III alpha subunit